MADTRGGPYLSTWYQFYWINFPPKERTSGQLERLRLGLADPGTFSVPTSWCCVNWFSWVDQPCLHGCISDSVWESFSCPLQCPFHDTTSFQTHVLPPPAAPGSWETVQFMHCQRWSTVSVCRSGLTSSDSKEPVHTEMSPALWVGLLEETGSKSHKNHNPHYLSVLTCSFLIWASSSIVYSIQY